MLPSFLLSLREGLEAALVIGIVLGAVRKMRRPELVPVVWTGALSAIGVSGVTALILNYLDAELEGSTEVIFEGITMLLAAGLLTWMIFWMHRQSRSIRGELEAGVRRATSTSGKRAIFFLSFMSVLREGVELAIFITAASLATDPQQSLGGAVLGLGAASLLGWSLFASTVRLDLGRFFQITGFLLILFSAGLVAHGVHELNEVGWIPAVIDHVWDVNFILNEQSTIGQMLITLFGYNSNPSLTEVLAYLGYFGALAIGLKLNSQAAVPSTQEA